MIMTTPLLALLGLALATPAADQPATEARPNIVLIVADDLGWADLTCYGSKFHRTPNLDRLAERGRRFTQAYAGAPVCSPTRAALLTGKHPARLHLTDWLPGRPTQPGQKLQVPPFLQHLPLEETTLAEALKSRGYTTAQVGKWHLGGPGFGPREQGFDVNIASDQTGTPLSYFAPFSRGTDVMPGLETAPSGEYLTDLLTADAEKIIEANQARPFFLYMPHYAVHMPLEAKKELIDHYPAWDGTYHGRQENPVYAAMLESLDESVGRIMAKLEATGLTDKTIIVFTSDNGGLATFEGGNTPATSNAPLREGKGWLYEGGLRVPLIISRPGVVEPGVENNLVWSGDIFSTLTEWAGVAPSAATLDGTSLAGQLSKPVATSHEPRPLFWHYPHYANQGSRPGGAIREGDWKFVEDYQTGKRELFNVGSDVGENQNHIEDQPDIAQQLAQKLDDWRKAVGAQMPTLNPDYSPNAQLADGLVVLPARTVEVRGVMLRYEPLPHKQTLGYWVNANDWAGWEFDLKTPGTYEVEALVGCGDGNGGSLVEFTVDGHPFRLTVPVTGGFQKFVPQNLGTVTFDKPGRKTVEIHVIKKSNFAVMDVRQMRLIPQK